MIRGRRLFWIFGLAGVNRRVPFAVVVEAEVDDKVFAHDMGAGDEILQRRKILVAPCGPTGFNQTTAMGRRYP